jgi:hypothetical protein
MEREGMRSSVAIRVASVRRWVTRLAFGVALVALSGTATAPAAIGVSERVMDAVGFEATRPSLSNTRSPSASSRLGGFVQ